MMVPTGSCNESENVFYPGNTGFTRGMMLCMKGGGEDVRANVKDEELPVHQPMSGSLPCAVQ